MKYPSWKVTSAWQPIFLLSASGDRWPPSRPSVAPALAGPLSAASGLSSAPPRWTLDAGSSPLAGAPASAPADAPLAVSTRVRVRPLRYSLILHTKPFRISPGLQGEGRYSEVTPLKTHLVPPITSYVLHHSSLDPSLALLWGPMPELVPGLPVPLPPSALLPWGSESLSAVPRCQACEHPVLWFTPFDSCSSLQMGPSPENRFCLFYDSKHIFWLLRTVCPGDELHVWI